MATIGPYWRKLMMYLKVPCNSTTKTFRFVSNVCLLSNLNHENGHQQGYHFISPSLLSTCKSVKGSRSADI